MENSAWKHMDDIATCKSPQSPLQFFAEYKKLQETISATKPKISTAYGKLPFKGPMLRILIYLLYFFHRFFMQRKAKHAH